MEEPEGRVCSAGEEAGSRGAKAGGSMADVATMCDDIDDADFDPAKFHIEEGMVAEVMKRLEEEINQPCGGGGFEQYQVVPSLPLSSAFVTINGNEESCGPSFSDSASTVMASIDTRGVVGLPQFPPDCGAKAEAADEVWSWSPEAEEGAYDPAAAEEFGVEDMGVVGDDGWLARVLAGAGLEGEGEQRLGG